jgi:hypothetical protein
VRQRSDAGSKSATERSWLDASARAPLEQRGGA